MTKKRAIIALGLLVALMPFLGFPREVRETITVFSGLVIAALAFLLKRKLVAEEVSNQNGAFAQNGFHREESHPHLQDNGGLTGTN